MATGLLLAGPAWGQEARWKELDTQVDQLQRLGKMEESLPVAQEELRVAESTFGPEHANTATALYRLGESETLLSQYAEAESLLKRALAIREKVFGPQGGPVAQSLNGVGEVYYYEGKHVEAREAFQRALAVGEKALGPEDIEVAESLNDLGIIYDELGRYAEAEPLYIRALAIREKALGPQNGDVAETLNNLANLYMDQCRYPEAEAVHKRALAIHEKVEGPDGPDVAMDLGNLGMLYRAEGRYGENEVANKRALAIYEKILGPEHPSVATILSNLADLYQEQGRFGEAEALLKRALEIMEKALGPEHPNVANGLNALARLYVAKDRYAEAEPLHKRALAIREKALGPDHPDVAVSLNNLGLLYVDEGKYDEAEPLYKRGIAIQEKVLGPNDPQIAILLGNLSWMYAEQGRYGEAEPLAKRSLEINEKSLGPDHPAVATDLYSLSRLYYGEGHYQQAEQVLQRSLRILRGRFEYSFAYMSEKDRLQFLATERDVFILDFTLAVAEHGQDPAVAGRMYDLLLWQKGLVGTSVAALRAEVAASGDAQAVKIFEELSAKKSQSSRLVAARPTGWQEERARIDAQANELEQQLARRVSSFAAQKSMASATWQDVQTALKPGDAAVEFVRFPFQESMKREWNKTTYVALVVRPGNSQPGLLKLAEAKLIEGDAFSAYRAEVGIRKSRAPTGEEAAIASPWRSLYDAVWKPLEGPLGGAQRVYVSVDGVLNEIPLGVLQGADGRRVLEKYDFRVVSSTRDLLRVNHPAKNNTAILVGNPKFLMSEAEQLIAVNRLGGLEEPGQGILVASAATPGGTAGAAISRAITERGGCNPPPPNGGVLCPLPGTATEVQSIGKLLLEKHWQVASYQGDQALEEVVKKAASPRVLHLATHGFFLADEKGNSESEDPMMRSGLFFAGADRTLKMEAPKEGIENGVLTAYEATELNLQGTELVVLSACETARGKVQSGEGVFGLGRALQEAGAEAVLMSLWSVPDQETQEMMTEFYRNWVGGMEKAEALRQAEIAEREVVRKRYGKDVPYYWGAFVLVGR
jgi:CHAT domain-containing protein/tetratricopeptide (TPR) repeat protein